MKFLSIVLVGFSCLVGRAQEAVSVFNGKDLSGWVDAKGRPHANGGWKVEADGVLHLLKKTEAVKPGDLYLEGEYGDFELSFEWKVAVGGNSGVKYRLTGYDGKLMGPEYQLLDDERHPDGKKGPNRQTGALYDLKEADAGKKKMPAFGEWNITKIVAKGSVLEHWLNGVKVMSIDTSSEEWKARHAASKFSKTVGYGQNGVGRIHFQEHGDEAWFRNISLKGTRVPLVGK